MFPHIQAQNREAGWPEMASPISGESWLAVETTAIYRLSAPAMPSRNQSGKLPLLKFCFEVINGAEVTFDSRFQSPCRVVPFFRPFQNRLWLAYRQRCCAVRFSCLLAAGPVWDQLFNRQVGKFWQAFQRRVGLFT